MHPGQPKNTALSEPSTTLTLIKRIISPQSPETSSTSNPASIRTPLSRDVKEYGDLNKSFLHETTANQFFTEAQLESYRTLGRHIFNTIAANHNRHPDAPIPPSTLTNSSAEWKTISY